MAKVIVKNVPVRGFITVTVEVEGEVTQASITKALQHKPPFFSNREIEESEMDDEAMRGWDFDFEVEAP